jgi:hypothetical protein
MALTYIILLASGLRDETTKADTNIGCGSEKKSLV